jgi:O-antigen ligase
MKANSQLLVYAALMLGALGLFVLAQTRPGYFSNTTYLGAILLTQIVIVGLWHYERIFFPLLLFMFVWAGTAIPYGTAAITARWFVLAFGAFAGYVKWMKSRRQHFGAFHLTALFCVLAALVSAMESALPDMALLKVLSFFLLLLYGSSGARLAILDREEKFINGLLLGSELTVYVTVISYFVLHNELFGNPNSLGAVIGVLVTPVLLWGTLFADRGYQRQRRVLAVFLCIFLLYFSLSRAGMAAAMVAAFVLCVSLGRQKLLLQGAFLLLFFLAVAGVLEPAHFDQFTSTIPSAVLYKGKRPEGLLGSRRTPWQQTVSIIQEHPWFGSGFGTSELGPDKSKVKISSVETKEEAGREHGSSYLAITEWLGLLGMIPFALLFFLLIRKIGLVCLWMRRTANPHHSSIPIALVLTAGLVHGVFEDWIVAVGYYLTVLFWTFAFILMDIAPDASPNAVHSASVWSPPTSAIQPVAISR